MQNTPKSKRQVKKQAKILARKLELHQIANPTWANPGTVTFATASGEIYVMGNWAAAYAELDSQARHENFWMSY